MTDGSRWYFPVYEGLFAAKHCEQMGPALWLYGWMIARAHIARAGGVVQYNHLTAANDLGKSERTVRSWFQTLQQNGYITTRARHKYHLEVQVTNWRAVEEWLEARRDTPDGQLLAGLGKEGETGSKNGSETGRETGRKLPPSIYITLGHYEYPTGSAGEPASLCDAFAWLLERLREEPNKAALLRRIYILCYGEADAPDFSYLGRAAKTVGGAGRLAALLWQYTTRRPSGDVLAYLMATEKQRKARRGGAAGKQADIEKRADMIKEFMGRTGTDG